MCAFGSPKAIVTQRNVFFKLYFDLGCKHIIKAMFDPQCKRGVQKPQPFFSRLGPPQDASEKEKKWLHAMSLSPMAEMTTEALRQVPADVTTDSHPLRSL